MHSLNSNSVQVTKIFQDAISFIIQRLEQNIDLFSLTEFPAETTFELLLQPKRSGSWTEGFWPGQLWLAYLLSNNARFKNRALGYIEEFSRRIKEKDNVDHHDMGFLYSLSCVYAWKMCGNTKGREVALEAARQLINRYLPSAGIIQAWGDLDDPIQQGRMIIDCTMNLPLLFWAWEQTSDPIFCDAALSHLAQSSKFLFRSDNSTYHTYHFNPTTGEPEKGTTHQGFSDDSCWSRGQAWAIYGFALAYKYTGIDKYLEDSIRATDYFINHLPQDHVPYWDLVFTEGDEERDSSAGAIAVCGMIELANHLNNLNRSELSSLYSTKATEILESLCTNYLTINEPKSNALLLEGVYSKPANLGVKEATAWGDYFLVEALSRIVQPGYTYW